MDIHNIISFIVSTILVINTLLAAGVLFFERRDIGYTWAWLMVLFFIPILGFIIYIFLGRNLKRNNFYRLTLEERAFLQSAVDQQISAFGREDQHRSPLLNEYTDVVRMNLISNHALLTHHNQIAIFNDGEQKFHALFADIRAAKKEINVQYYIIQPDSLGERLRDELTKKAKEGVKVRVLYDEIGSKKISPTFFKDLLDFGGEVEVFFPSLLRLINFRMNNRNHRKLCIIDGKVAYIGGFNVGNEYLGANTKFGYWRDTHLRMEGEAVNHIQARFILDWNQAGKHKKLEHDGFCFNSEKHEGDVPVQIVASGPNSEDEHLKNMYIKLIMNAKKSVAIQTPYFIPDSSFMDACKIALLSGVDVRIMIPSKPDHPFVYWASWVYAGELLKYGANVLLYEKGFLHAKTIVVDERVASVGTMNIDSRSFRLNFEVNAMIYDRAIAKQLKDMFNKDTEVCKELTLERYKERSLIIKFKEDVSRLLSPIL
ncbi:major cardiolipin synthase ClsA [Pullulanibacillus camelliae]|uniref:Cardiolipin synthase n=1 Tax=Pullulanibacillus camelliae TaxID=1707096 RepID=A0A8J2YN64_9BACL|nr:cardiolipin synthase [Pullulanibacillus camelliae]GGE55952.1 major cardiolipin synthase ClsA [Pullulanibacillus camelliae]